MHRLSIAALLVCAAQPASAQVTAAEARRLLLDEAGPCYGTMSRQEVLAKREHSDATLLAFAVMQDLARMTSLSEEDYVSAVREGMRRVTSAQDPAVLARAAECERSMTALAHRLPAAHAQALRYGLYGAASPAGPARAPSKGSAGDRARDDATTNADAFVGQRGFVGDCRVWNGDDGYVSMKPVERMATDVSVHPATLPRDHLQALASAGRTVFQACTYSAPDRANYLSELTTSRKIFAKVRPTMPVTLKIIGQSDKTVDQCERISTSTQRNYDRSLQVTTTYEGCGKKTVDVNRYTKIKGVSDMLLLARPNESRMAAMVQRMRCALFVRDLNAVAAQLPEFLAAMGGWKSLQDYFAPAGSGRQRDSQRRVAAAKQTRGWARKIADELFFPSPGAAGKGPARAGADVPENAVGLLAQVLGSGPHFAGDQPNPRLRSPVCNTSRRRKDHIGYEPSGSEDGNYCYIFDETTDPLVCAPFHPQLWTVVDRLRPKEEVSVSGDDIYQ